MRRSSNRVNEILHAVTKRVSAHERGDQTYASLYRRTRTEAADARDVEPASMAPRRQAGDQSREASAAYAIEAPRPAGVILNASRCDEAGARTGDPNHRRHPGDGRRLFYHASKLGPVAHTLHRPTPP